MNTLTSIRKKRKDSAIIKVRLLSAMLAIAIFAAYTPQSFGFTINAGDILVANDGNSTVIKIDPNTGQQTLLATFTTVTTNGTQYGGVHDLALSPNGDLIVLQHEPTVSRVNLVTGAITNISSGGLLGTDAQGTLRFGLAVAPNGDIYVAVYGPNADIVKVDPNTGAQSSVASGGYITGPIGLGFSPSGELMVADNYSARLIGINTTTHAQRLVASNIAPYPNSPWGMTIDTVGNVYLGTGGTNKIQKVSSAGSVSIAASGGFLDVPYDVALEPGGTLLSFQSVSNAIVRINPTNNIQTIVSKGGFLSLSLSLIVAGFPVTGSNAPAQLAIQMYPGISIQGTPGGTYSLQYTDSLTSTNWLSLTNIFLSSSPYLFFDTTSTNQARRFYRAVAQ
jgi:streptogramin lyase